VLEAEEAGCDVILHVHDEVVLHAREEEAESAKKSLLAFFRTPPQWLPDLPGDAGGLLCCHRRHMSKKDVPAAVVEPATQPGDPGNRGRVFYLPSDSLAFRERYRAASWDPGTEVQRMIDELRRMLGTGNPKPRQRWPAMASSFRARQRGSGACP